MKFITLLLLLFSLCVASTIEATAQATELPLLTINALEYEGAFVVPGGEIGDSHADYPAGPIAYNSANNSIFYAGFNLDGSVAEFGIPVLTASTNVEDLNTATVIQPFSNVLNNAASENPQNIDLISGLFVYENKLIINGLEYYDAAVDNTHTTLVINDASNIAGNSVNEYLQLEGEAHAAGWMSAIPEDWHELLGNTHLVGNSSKAPINSRLPMGISAFSVAPEDIVANNSNFISTTTLMDFSLENPLYADFEMYENANYNALAINGETPPGHTQEDAMIVVGDNNMWTEQSQASFGFIVPGTRTYLTIGASSGHNSGIGYKPTQNNGNVCGGPCAYDADDVYNYYWLWDVNDLLAVKNGTLAPHDVRPYEYGIFEAPFQTDIFTNTPEFHDIVGGTYDPVNQLLYLSIYDGGSTGAYDVIPVIAAYSIPTTILNNSASEIATKVTLVPNPTISEISISLTTGVLKQATIFNSLGQSIATSNSPTINVNSLPNGIYTMYVEMDSGEVISKLFVKK